MASEHRGFKIRRKLQCGCLRHQSLERAHDRLGAELRAVRTDQDVIYRVNLEQDFGVADQASRSHVEVMLGQDRANKRTQIRGLIQNEHPPGRVLVRLLAEGRVRNERMASSSWDKPAARWTAWLT